MNNGFKVVKILLKLLYSLPGYWGDGVTEEEYVLISSYLIENNPSLYGDMVEGREHLFSPEILEKAGYPRP